MLQHREQSPLYRLHGRCIPEQLSERIPHTRVKVPSVLERIHSPDTLDLWTLVDRIINYVSHTRDRVADSTRYVSNDVPGKEGKWPHPDAIDGTVPHVHAFVLERGKRIEVVGEAATEINTQVEDALSVLASYVLAEPAARRLVVAIPPELSGQMETVLKRIASDAEALPRQFVVADQPIGMA